MVGESEERDAAHQEMDALTEAGRIQARSHVVVHTSCRDVLHENSHDATVVLLGFHPPEPGADAKHFHDNFERLLEGLPTTLLVCSSGDADLNA